MIYSLRGKIIHKGIDMVVIECGGVGYCCRTTLATLSQVGGTGDEAMLYTYMYLREDALELFGFATERELSCFKMLISVSGVGPKAGLSILSDTDPERFAMIVASGDYKALTKTKGVGTKLAQRVVLELKDKISKEQPEAASAEFVPMEDGSGTSEAAAALVVLGYSRSEAMSALAGLDQSLPVEELIRQSLKKMAQNR